MLSVEQIKEIARETPSKIILLVIDGLGGLPLPETGKTELETAHTPNLDRLAAQGLCGLIDPVGPGITPGSAPGHLALFGYDPIRFTVGRGVMEALGIDFDLQGEDVAARGNFCTVDERGLVIDRRAGRISTEKCAELCRLLEGLKLNQARLFVAPVKEHRFVVVLRGDGLSGDLSDTDPQREGLAPKEVMPLSPGSAKAAALANEFLAQAKKALGGLRPANMVLLRGFAQRPRFPSMSEVFLLQPAAIAAYPMYRGLAKLVGMETLRTGDTIEEEFTTLGRHYEEYDFFYVHVKKTDAAGEDGDFQAKVRALEEVDSSLPLLLELGPDVLIVTGDHSTPALLRSHSWHPVPFLLHSRWCRPGGVGEFSERSCARGALGRFPATAALPLALGHALKLDKFGP